MNWFKHDINSLADDRLSALVQEHGAEGYAVFYSIVEALYANEGSPLDRLSLKRIAKDFGLSFQKVVEIADYAASDECGGLLRKCSDGYSSERVCKAIEENEAIVKAKKEAAYKRWQKYRDTSNADAMQMQSKCITDAEQVQSTSNADAMQIREDKSRGDEKEKPTVSNEPVGKEKCEDKPASRPGNGMPEIVLKDGTRWTPPETYIVTKQKAYPAVDVMAELWKMAGKTSQRPQSRPLPFNLDGFVNGWLDNAVRDMDRPRARDPDRRIVTDHEERMKGVNPDGTYTI